MEVNILMKKKRTYIIYGISVVLYLYIMCESVYAGLNGNAESILAAAGGTFEYDGKYYHATDSALSSLRVKLDGKDITEQQAAQAIAMLNRNVEKGIEQGLLVEAGDSQEESTEPEKTESDTTSAIIEESTYSDDLKTYNDEKSSEYKETQPETYVQPQVEMSSGTQELENAKETERLQTVSERHYGKLPAIAGMIISVTAIILIFYRIVMLKNR